MSLTPNPIQVAEQLKMVPNTSQGVQYLASLVGGQNPMVPGYIAAAELASRKYGPAQPQQPPQAAQQAPVVQQVAQEVAAGLPSVTPPTMFQRASFQRGGIVGFAGDDNGSYVRESYTATPEERQVGGEREEAMQGLRRLAAILGDAVVGPTKFLANAGDRIFGRPMRALGLPTPSPKFDTPGYTGFNERLSREQGRADAGRELADAESNALADNPRAIEAADTAPAPSGNLYGPPRELAGLATLRRPAGAAPGAGGGVSLSASASTRTTGDAGNKPPEKPGMTTIPEMSGPELEAFRRMNETRQRTVEQDPEMARLLKEQRDLPSRRSEALRQIMEQYNASQAESRAGRGMDMLANYLMGFGGAKTRAEGFAGAGKAAQAQANEFKKLDAEHRKTMADFMFKTAELDDAKAQGDIAAQIGLRKETLQRQDKKYELDAQLDEKLLTYFGKDRLEKAKLTFEEKWKLADILSKEWATQLSKDAQIEVARIQLRGHQLSANRVPNAIQEAEYLHTKLGVPRDEAYRLAKNEGGPQASRERAVIGVLGKLQENLLYQNASPQAKRKMEDAALALAARAMNPNGSEAAQEVTIPDGPNKGRYRPLPNGNFERVGD